MHPHCLSNPTANSLSNPTVQSPRPCMSLASRSLLQSAPTWGGAGRPWWYWLVSWGRSLVFRWSLLGGFFLVVLGVVVLVASWSFLHWSFLCCWCVIVLLTWHQKAFHPVSGAVASLTRYITSGGWATTDINNHCLICLITVHCEPCQFKP